MANAAKALTSSLPTIRSDGPTRGSFPSNSGVDVYNPAPTALQLGWESYHGESMTLWMDDVVVSGTPIGYD